MKFLIFLMAFFSMILAFIHICKRMGIDVIGILNRFIGNALDEDIFERYCDNIAWDIVRAVDQVMEQVFDEPAEEDVAND